MANTDFVQVSPRDPHYFSLSSGAPYIPIGLNLCFVRFTEDEAEGLARYEKWIKALARGGGNFFRLWLSHPFFEVEYDSAGSFDESRARRVDAVLAMARAHGLRVKLCLEHFRTLEGGQPPFPGAPSFAKSIYHVSRGGALADMSGFFQSAEGRALYLRRLDFFAARYAGEAVVFGWELWNEINAVQGEGWLEWTAAMLPELKKRFPDTLALQSLGGFEYGRHRATYQELAQAVPGGVAQVHRYLNPGAELKVCRGSMDALVADAVRELRVIYPANPILLAETGAVEAHHAGPFALYPKDQEGMLLHDMLYAPFFAGAAGPGHAWHWDFYVEKNNLWHHFDRFAQLVSGLDPSAEEFQPGMLPHPRLRVYTLRGREHTLLWCRDSANTWKSELLDGIAPQEILAQALDLTALWSKECLLEATQFAQVFDPWENLWSDVPFTGGQINLPAFRRSLAVVIQKGKTP
jgi:hypothetical protein